MAFEITKLHSIEEFHPRIPSPDLNTELVLSLEAQYLKKSNNKIFQVHFDFFFKLGLGS